MLFAFDFDNTILYGKLHDYVPPPVLDRISDSIYSSQEHNKSESSLDSVTYFNDITFDVIGHVKTWRHIFTEILNQNHLVAIVSFSNHPNLIYQFLHEKLLLSKNQIDQIAIVAETPNNLDVSTKNRFIRKAVKMLDVQLENKDIVLIDDDKFNIKAAHRSGYKTILADKKGRHLRRLEAILNRPTEANTMDNQVDNGGSCAPFFRSLFRR